MRRNLLILQWPPASPDAAAQAQTLVDVADRHPAWRRAHAAPGLAVWRRGPADLPLRVLDDGESLILGDIVPALDAPRQPGAALAATAATLVRQIWGAYVAVLRSPAGDWSLLRDPSGEVDLITWRLSPTVAVAASALEHLPAGFTPRRMALDWDRIVALLTVPVAATTESLFDDVLAVGPGDACPLGGGPLQAVWRPSAFAAPIDHDPNDLAGAFVARLDACAAALVAPHARVLAELSGGLDSSAVAAALAATGQGDRVAAWLNIADPRPEADERRYAQAVADRIGAPLTVVTRRPPSLQPEDLEALAGWTWPALTSVDVSLDREEVRRIRETGATAVVSGQGGDAVFFEMPSPYVAADLWRAHGLLTLLADPRLGQIARRGRQTVWEVLREARRGLTGTGSGPKNINGLVTAAARDQAAGTEHAWVRDLANHDLPPGKRVHIRAMATSHFNHTPSHRRDAADQLSPLLAQPIMELALGVPTPLLAAGNPSRPFQRRAFADRLPALVRDRPAKGNVSVYLAQFVARNLDLIRPYLIDGVLAEAGVLDRARLQTVLNPDYLILSPAGTDLVGAIAVEAWVRRWQTRVPDGSGRWRR